MKKLYHVSQDINTGYDTYSDFVVCALSEDEARRTHPSKYESADDWWKREQNYSTWCNKLQQVKVIEIGIANENVPLKIICKSFHAG